MDRNLESMIGRTKLSWTWTSERSWTWTRTQKLLETWTRAPKKKKNRWFLAIFKNKSCFGFKNVADFDLAFQTFKNYKLWVCLEKRYKLGPQKNGIEFKRINMKIRIFTQNLVDITRNSSIFNFRKVLHPELTAYRAGLLLFWLALSKSSVYRSPNVAAFFFAHSLIISTIVPYPTSSTRLAFGRRADATREIGSAIDWSIKILH